MDWLRVILPSKGSYIRIARSNGNICMAVVSTPVQTTPAMSPKRPPAPRSAAAKRIAQELKGWIESGKFLIAEKLAPIPGPESGQKCKPFSGNVLKVE